jgi:hypothetical protein
LFAKVNLFPVTEVKHIGEQIPNNFWIYRAGFTQDRVLV